MNEVRECRHISVEVVWQFRYGSDGWHRYGPDWECRFCHTRLMENDKVIHEIRSQFGAMELRGFS